MNRPEAIGKSPYTQNKESKKEIERNLVWKQYNGKFCKFQLHHPASLNIFELEYFDRADGKIKKIKFSEEDRKYLIRLLQGNKASNKER